MYSEVIFLKIRIAASPLFPGQQHFPQGRGFKQWTGDDLKALMKVHSLSYVLALKTNFTLTGVFACNQWTCATPDGLLPCGFSGVLLPGQT